MDLMTGIAAAGQALDIVKKLREIDQDFDKAEFKLQIADLYSALAETRIALADAKEAIAEKEAEIARLKAPKLGRMRTVSYRGFNFGIDENGVSIGRPYCPNCEQTRGLQMQITRGPGGQTDYCPACKSTYGRGGYPWKLPDGYDTSGAA